MSAVDDVLKYIATNEIRWIDLQFFDLKGALHRVSVSNRKIEEASFSNGIYAADLTEVYGASDQSNLVLSPDPETMARLPWETATIRLICDVIVADSKERFLKDVRYVAERVETNLNAQGIKTALVGSEVDCYMFDSATADKASRPRGMGVLMESREARWSPSPLSNDTSSGAYVSTPHDAMYVARTQICETMEDSFGMLIDSHRHGKSPTSQQTFETAERNLKSGGDALNTLKFVTRNLVTALNASVTFMPYPVEGERGNSLRIAMSLWKSNDNNLFYEGKDDYGQLSQSGRYFIGGLLEHAAAVTFFTMPTPNSYRRLHLDEKLFGWSALKTNTLVHVPSTKKNIKEAKRVVFTLADPSADPYLAYAAVAAAGLDGIKNKTDPGDSLENDKKTRTEKKIPQSLHEAIQALESDPKFIKGVVPTELLGDLLDLKMSEHKESLKGVTTLELQKYFNI